MMFSQIVLVILVASLLLLTLLVPFWLGEGGALESAAAFDDVELLEQASEKILQRYLAEEKAAAEGDLTQTEWKKREVFLTDRYVDLRRRHDYLVEHASKDGE
ncbi:MAG: hypothetical protein OXT67_09565 [Zetaproteobacteria bacterium]|nr:hypothetical protein [Zetaproteobacteria bacterium]